jgi:hypothetical protein
MNCLEIDHMLNFIYEKTSSEIIEKAKAKRVAVLAKIEERKDRIRRTRAEFGITDEVLIDLLQQARADSRNVRSTYMSKSKRANAGLADEATEEVVVPAGVVNNLMTEQDLISGEIDQVAKLDLVIRNLVDRPDERRGQEGKVCGHRLSNDELVYLGF